MDFNTSIEFSGNQFPLWNLAEQYLNVSEKRFKAIRCTDTTVYVQKSQDPQQSWLSKVLKIASYATIIFPLIALGIKAAYRSEYEVEVVRGSEALAHRVINTAARGAQTFFGGMRKFMADITDDPSWEDDQRGPSATLRVTGSSIRLDAHVPV